MNIPDHSHKRTSITELLNPIAATPTGSLQDQAFRSNQLPGISTSSYVPSHHQQQVSAPPSYSPSIASPGASSGFSLRAASWDHANPSNDMAVPRRPEDDPSYRRYPPSAPPQPAYHDQYARPSRPADEAPTSPYGMGVPVWHGSHDAVNPPYPPSATSPTYTEDRAAVPDNSVPRNYAHSQYEQDMAQQQYYSNVYQSTERASVRLAARGSMPLPPPQTQQRVPAPPPAFYPPQFLAVPFAAPVLPPPSQKRNIDQIEEEPAPPPKTKKSKTRAKSSADGAASSSKRGYNTKKRNEAAQIAAKNAEHMPTVSYTKTPGAQGRDGLLNGDGLTQVSYTDEDGSSKTAPLRPELQFARCMSNRYRSEEFPRCVACTRRWAGDTCRFQAIRFFLKDDKQNIVGVSFVENQKPDGPNMSFPTRWNISLQAPHIGRVKRTVARALLPTLLDELTHLKTPEIIRRPREVDVRATCDTCMTSIFSSSWMCRLCGREACAECFLQVKDLTVDRPGATEEEIAALQIRRERHAHVNPFFLSCTRRTEHRATDFSPMSRFSVDELTQVIEEMQTMLNTSDQQDALPTAANGNLSHAPPASFTDTSDTTAPSVAPVAGSETAPSSSTGPPNASTSSTPAATSAPSSRPTTIPSHQTQQFDIADLTDDAFRRVWTKGEPLVVTGLLPRFREQWTPEEFTVKYGTQSCLILECQTDRNKKVSVGDFFSLFGRYEGRRDCWKLKDWPPSADFKTMFPELYDDFCQATPVPNYVRRDGVLNIASHFPTNAVGPDLGPKMYNAMASYEGPGSKGSTRLHMDMADAVNIMLYSAPTPQGEPGSAAWDLFQAEDSVKLRKFLRKKFRGQYQHDPIHSQQLYLDSQLRQELFDEFGVKSHRIYQKPGEAVFIPAGCAHQVCNLADCIKVASDFVSPENIDRCETLTREFREQNQSMVWKEDVLQLRAMMWYAWLSSSRQEQDLLSAAQDKEKDV